MDFLLRNLVIFAIAPCVGAWIEVILYYLFLQNIKSHPAWVRGLKYPCSIAGKECHYRTLRGCVD